MKNRKGNVLIKTLLIILDIVAIMVLIMATLKWINSKNITNSSTDNHQTVKYKKFILNIPKNVKYQEIDNYKFSLENDNYRAIIEIYSNENNFAFSDTDKFRDTLIEDGYKIVDYTAETISKMQVIVFDNYNDQENASLCYFRIVDPFAVQVELINKNSEANNIQEIVDILLGAGYETNNKTYNYHKFIPNEN